MIRDYTITTWDGKHYSIDEKNGDRLIGAWSDAEKPFAVNLNGAAISSSNIKSIDPNFITEADIPSPTLQNIKQIESGVLCKGQYSIQKEINNIARNEHPNDWAKYIKNKKWRAKTRQQLLEITDHWCDYKSAKCVCE